MFLCFVFVLKWLLARGRDGFNARASADAVSSEKRARPLVVGAGAGWHQHSKPGIAAEHLQAAQVFGQLGMTSRWTAYAFRRWPQLGDMEPAELQACVDALLAAFGGRWSAVELRKRLYAWPEVLMLSPKQIAAGQAWLASLGLAKVDRGGGGPGR